MKEEFFEFLAGMIDRGVSPDTAADLAFKLTAPRLAPAVAAKTAKKAVKSPGGVRNDSEELATILNGVQWPMPWKEALHAAAEAAGITPGRANFKLMALVKQQQIYKAEDNLYHKK
ncbi:MAG: hypothetical protein QM627_04840 [Luteolibacter sp.]